jgi:hypothetical protein
MPQVKKATAGAAKSDVRIQADLMT